MPQIIVEHLVKTFHVAERRAGLWWDLPVIESLEIMNTLTYGGVEAGRYPIAIYRPGFRAFFTYAVPLACVTYYPALPVMEHLDPLGSSLVFQYCAPEFGLLFLGLALQCWKFGVRHYQSTGS